MLQIFQYIYLLRFFLNISAGINRRFELKCGAPVVWVVCLKHGNEKPWGKYLKYCDGFGTINTKSPSFDGHLGILFKDGIKKGQELVDYESFPDCNFQEMPKDHVKSMNNDYQMLHNYCVAVKSGTISKELAARIIGKCHQARYV